MKKIILVKNHIQLGPQPIFQYPPDSTYPPNEFFLRIWARHEIHSDRDIVEYNEQNANSDNKFLSIIKKIEQDVYFIIIEIEKSTEFHKFPRDVILNLSNSVFNNLDSPKRLSRIISEMFYSLNSFARMTTDQLFYNIFSDKDKFLVLEEFRNGIITKNELSHILWVKYGFSKKNLEIIINPFIALEIILSESIPGIQNCIMMKNDVFLLRIPPKNIIKSLQNSNKQADKMYLNEVKTYFSVNRADSDEIVNKISRVMKNTEVFHAYQKLLKEKIATETFLSYIGHDMEKLIDLKQLKIVVEIEDYCYLLSDLRFVRFNPLYLIKKLKSRFLAHEISIDQFITHINLLKENS